MAEISHNHSRYRCKCPTCGAKRGKPCQTSGGTTTRPHASRIEANAKLIQRLRGK